MKYILTILIILFAQSCGEKREVEIFRSEKSEGDVTYQVWNLKNHSYNNTLKVFVKGNCDTKEIDSWTDEYILNPGEEMEISETHDDETFYLLKNHNGYKNCNVIFEIVGEQKCDPIEKEKFNKSQKYRDLHDTKLPWNTPYIKDLDRMK